MLSLGISIKPIISISFESFTAEYLEGLLLRFLWYSFCGETALPAERRDVPFSFCFICTVRDAALREQLTGCFISIRGEAFYATHLS